MDLSALAQDMLKWEQMKRATDELEQAIKDSILQLGKTQTVGHVRATYSNGRKRYNYQDAADSHPMVSEATLKLFTKTTTTVKTDWRGICKHAGIDDIPYTQGNPSVSVKLMP